MMDRQRINYNVVLAMFDMKLLPVLVDVHDDDEYDDYYAHGHPLQTPTKQD